MSYLAGKLKHRIHIFQAVDELTKTGGFKRKYKKLLTLWSGKKQVSNYIKAIRAANTENNKENNKDIDTDEFIVRYGSVVSKFYRTFNDGFSVGEDSQKSDGMGKAFDGGFDNGTNSEIDMYPIKADYFVFLQQGDNTAYRGRLYKINSIIRDDNTKELIVLRCKEVEETGFGAEI